MKTLSVVIPCYNEGKNLVPLLRRCADVYARQDVELVLVDNGSTDETAELLSELLPKYPFARSVRVEQNQGYGHGIYTGLRAAEGKFLAWTHADLQTDPADVMQGLQMVLQQTDARRCFAKGRRRGRPPGDVFFTVGMSLFETLLLGVQLWDINAQPNIMPREFFQRIKNPPKDFSFDLFFYYSAKRAGLKILRFPVVFAERASGVSHWNTGWKGKLAFIRRTVDYSLRLRREISRSKG